MQRTWVASCGDVYASSSNLNSSDTAKAFFFSPSQFYSDVPLLRVIHPFSTAFEAFHDHLGNSSQISRKRDDSGD